MDLRPFSDYRALSRWAADEIIGAVERQPRLLLCPATGSTPRLTYRLLAEHAARVPGLFNHLRIVMLDEIIAPVEARPATCLAYLEEHLLHPLGIGPERVLAFRYDGDPEAEATRLRRGLTAWGPIDLCLLGLGANGHLGFIEPGEHLQPHAHIAGLHPSSQQHPMFSTLANPPTRGLTLGIADLLHSRRGLLLVNGAHKRPVVRQLLEEQVAPSFPASLLRLSPRVTCAVEATAMPEEGNK